MRIVYIDVDSLRPDHMSCYGYHRHTTPHIDALASEGTLFTHVYCEASPCVPSRASFMSGRFAINHGALTHWGPGGKFYVPSAERYSRRYPFFPRYLREAGYRTATISSFGDRHQKGWFFAGWSEIHSHTLKMGNEDAPEVNAHVLPWIKAHGLEENYFLHVQYWDPHGFYSCPDEWAERFATDPAPSFPDAATIEAQQSDYHPRSARMFHWAITPNIPAKMPHTISDRHDFERLINGYDGGIAYMDEHVGQIVAAYRELGIEEEVCFIISADHGESFGEQGLYMEHGMASESVHHIPLIMRLPKGHRRVQTVDTPLYNVDVMATLVEMVGLAVPPGWDGQSFFSGLEGQPFPTRPWLIMEHGLYACQRAVRDDQWYFIRTYHPGLVLFPPVALYDIHADPHQQHNVAADHPDVVAVMDHRLAEWVQQNRDHHGEIPDPMEAIMHTGPYRYLTPQDWAERLRDAGLFEEAEELLRRGARTLY
ncbi:MAG: sulfatase [Firmicutes bacterium]|nr:sulfatase [Bacillota bacterium]